MPNIEIPKNSFYESVKEILQTAKNSAYRQVNFIMVEAYWNIGKQIVEEEQSGEDRAKYGSYLIKELSTKLTDDFGKGFSKQNLWNMRQFYNYFPILSSLKRELSWTHTKLYPTTSSKLPKIVCPNFFNSSLGCNISGIWMTLIFADTADLTPFSESSSAKQR